MLSLCIIDSNSLFLYNRLSRWGHISDLFMKKFFNQSEQKVILHSVLSVSLILHPSQFVELTLLQVISPADRALVTGEEGLIVISSLLI